MQETGYFLLKALFYRLVKVLETGMLNIFIMQTDITEQCVCVNTWLQIWENINNNSANNSQQEHFKIMRLKSEFDFEL
jgi:hypothetical protein